MECETMPKWSKDATEFTVSVGYHEIRGYQVYIPRPVVEHLEIHRDKSRHPKPITFVLDGKRKVAITGEMTTVNRAKN